MNFRIVAVLILAIHLPATAQPKPSFSRMDVFGLEWVANPQISPDGVQIVYERKGMDIMQDRRQSRLWIINANGTGHEKLTPHDVSESSPAWSPDGSRIAYVSSTDEGAELFVYWIKTGRLSRLTQLERSPRGLSWSPDGRQIAFSMHVPGNELSLVKPLAKPNGAKWADAPRITTRLKHEADGSGYMEPGYAHLFVVPAEGGTARQITTGNYQHRAAPVWTKDGKQLIFSSNRNEDWEYDFRNSDLYTVSVDHGKITPLTHRKGPDSDPVVSPDGKSIAYLGFDDKIQTYQITRLYVMNLDGSGSREINTNLDRDIASPTWDAEGKGIFFQYDDQGNTKIGHVTLAGKTTTLTNNLGGDDPSRPYGGGSYSVAANGRMAFTHTTPDHPSELATLDKGSNKANLITALNSDLLDFRQLGQVEEIWYKSSIDKLDIQGWIVKPPFFEASKKYPLIVENHGGPTANYGDRFSPEMQLLAAGGYVVFYPNPRGSTSYGEKFGNELYHNYPGNDYHDVMDGVDAVLKKGYIDEDNLFVTGGSAGGIMTAWIIGKNNRFKAAVVVKPVMNWISKTLTADNYYGYANSRLPGQPWENIDTYMKFSPISLVGNIQTPTMVMVGTLDMRTPLSEAKQLYHALKIRKIETALVEIPGSYHYIANRPSQLITKIDHILAWFDRYRK